MQASTTNNEILKILAKESTTQPTITDLAREIGLTRVGMWKMLKKLESEKVILLSQIGSGKTSTYTVALNWGNPLVEKQLAVFFTEDALNYQRWLFSFAELEDKVEFLILYGSILHTPKKANDIDLLAVVSRKERFIQIEETLQKIQKTQVKKIHLISVTPSELSEELKKQNRAYSEVIKKGVILFGQEKFIKYSRGRSQR
ncbi:MAG TPA: hypothetical protein VJH37_03595 [Candidatus Nanoarchaeia archaeon]|nr:hypothetical protein [Candidatus Nanoarchaeia archaeon]